MATYRLMTHSFQTMMLDRAYGLSTRNAIRVDRPDLFLEDEMLPGSGRTAKEAKTEARIYCARQGYTKSPLLTHVIKSGE